MKEQLSGLQELIAPYADEWRMLLSIAGIVVIAFVARHAAVRVLHGFFAHAGERAATVEEKRRVDTVDKVVRRSASTLIVVVAAMVLLNQVGIPIAPILGAAGVVGIAIGFGAQSLVKDLFAGLFLLAENQIRVGDVVEIAGKSGVVEALSLRRTRLRSYDGSVHYISNGLITTVTNMSTDFAHAVVDIRVAYSEDVDRVFEIMRRTAGALRSEPGFASSILDDLEIAGVEEWGESAMMIRARLRTQPLEQWSVRREYLKRLKAAFDREEVSIPYPHRTVLVAGGAPAPALPPGR